MTDSLMSHLINKVITLLIRFDVRGLLEFPIDFKRATAKREGNPLDEAHMLAQHRFGDLKNQIDHGTSNLQNNFQLV